MNMETEFKCLLAQYCQVEPEDMALTMRFREDLGLSSLDFMSLLGELEDTFDVELEEENLEGVLTIEDALNLMERLSQEG